MTVCNEMYTNIRFDVDMVCSCCTNKRGVVVPVTSSSDVEEVMQLYSQKADYIFSDLSQNCKNKSNVNDDCKECYRLNDDFLLAKNINDKKINFINISNWRACNINCIYCCFKKEVRCNSKYNVYPYIKYLKDNNKLADDLQVIIAGGEPGVMQEIDELFEVLAQIPHIKIQILSNMVVFRKSYERFLKSGQLNINSSIDCSDKKLYKSIHGIDKYNVVINNMKKAIKCAKDKKQVKLKYIFIENINDSKEEIDKFIKLALKLKVGMVQFDFDRREDNIDKEIPSIILNLYEYSKKESAQNGIFVDLDPRSESMYKIKRYI